MAPLGCALFYASQGLMAGAPAAIVPTMQVELFSLLFPSRTCPIPCYDWGLLAGEAFWLALAFFLEPPCPPCRQKSRHCLSG